jgi:hypothetical protein
MINHNINNNSTDWGEHPTQFVSWKSVLAGFFLALFTMLGLLGLGMAFGGIGIDEESSLQGASIFTGLWFLVSTIIAILVGSFYSARLSSYSMPRIGAANGLLIASLFILFFVTQFFSVIGSIGTSAGAIVGFTATEATQAAASNPEASLMVTSYVEEQFLDLELRSSTQVVASGVASRLLNGNAKGAQNYLAYQANLSPEEAQTRVTEFSAQANRLIEQAKVTAADALKTAGWSLFFLIACSAIAAALGGFWGSRAIVNHSLTDDIGMLKTRET